MAPADPILGVSVAFNASKDPNKLNLGVGAYRNEEGKPVVLDVVTKVMRLRAARARRRRLDEQLMPQHNSALTIPPKHKHKHPTTNNQKKAEAKIVAAGYNKEYLPIEGLPAFRDATAKLLLGEGHPALSEGRVATLQALSGTGSLRVAAAFIAAWLPGAQVLISEPTWGNHR